MTAPRPSKSADAAAAQQQARIDAMTPAERILLALRLGRRARALAARDVSDGGG